MSYQGDAHSVNVGGLGGSNFNKQNMDQGAMNYGMMGNGATELDKDADRNINMNELNELLGIWTCTTFSLW